MEIKWTSVIVNDQEIALRFYKGRHIHNAGHQGHRVDYCRAG